VPAWLAVTILGVIEGVTEFLPISSTGHLLLVENAGWVPRQSDLFNITIQSGAALAVLLVFGGRLRDLLGRLHEPAARAYLMKLALAFAITGVGGLVIKRLGFALPKETAPIAWATLIGGVAILAVEWSLRSRPSNCKQGMTKGALAPASIMLSLPLEQAKSPAAKVAMSYRGPRTSICNNARRAGSSSPPRSNCRFGLQPGPAPDTAHSFFARFASPSARGGRHSMSIASSG